MAADDVLDFLALMDASGIHVWLDGGWAVDACLGSQTRRHADLDIVVEERDAAAAVALLRDRGYGPVPGRGGPAWNFVLGDSLGHEVDLHVVAFDERGDGVLGAPEDGLRYPAGSLTGTGMVGGRVVACVTAEWQVRFRSGYEPDADDWADVSALCERFAIPVPEAYRRFM